MTDFEPGNLVSVARDGILGEVVYVTSVTVWIIARLRLFKGEYCPYAGYYLVDKRVVKKMENPELLEFVLNLAD